MHFSDARVLPHPHPPRACPGPAPCPPSPPPPWNSCPVWVWGVPSDRWRRTSRGRPPHEAWGRLKPVVCILSDGCTGTWPNRFYSCFLGTVGFIVTFRLPHTINEKSSVHFFCLRGEKEKERPGILIAGCVSIVQDIRCLCVHPMPGLEGVISEGLRSVSANSSPGVDERGKSWGDKNF